MHIKKVCFVLPLMLISLTAIFGESVYKKKEIAVFRLSYYQWSIPNRVLGNIDDEINAVFTDLGRFNVIGMTYRLDENDVNTFIDSIKKYKEENVEIPEKVQMGKEYFTKADMNRLISSFIVVIPSVSYFNLERIRGVTSGKYKAVIKTSFTFVDVEKVRTISVVSIETTGYDDNPNTAVKEAVNDIAARLVFEIRKIPDFQLRSGVLEVRGGDVIIEFGKDMGVRIGDEYSVTRARILKSGKSYTEEKALLIVKEVNDEVSVAKVIYTKGKIEEGDPVKEIPRLGLDTTPYFHAAVSDGIYAQVGVRQSITRGFYRFRPILGLEVPLMDYGYSGLPVNMYVGGEMNLYLWRFQFVPVIGAGIGGSIPMNSDSFRLTHVGGLAGVTVSYLLNDSIKFVLDLGYLEWLGIGIMSYGGIFTGGGVTFKY
ncbi:MAG: hypothetical protein DRP57_01480 [Spirochaetes bacterium]|nr:MAG: hypothetical protein DRP57_01480 [Spirochaetota bacterium]